MDVHSSRTLSPHLRFHPISHPPFGWMSLDHSPQRHLFCGIPINLLWSLCRYGEMEESADSRVTSFHYRKTKRHGATHGFGKKLNLVMNSIKALLNYPSKTEAIPIGLRCPSKTPRAFGIPGCRVGMQGVFHEVQRGCGGHSRLRIRYQIFG